MQQSLFYEAGRLQEVLQTWKCYINMSEKRKTEVASTGIEPATLALLAPRSNQLS